MNIPEIKFGKSAYRAHEGGLTYAEKLSEVTASDINGYKDALLTDGFVKFEERTLGGCEYTAYIKDGDAVFLTYYPTVGEAVVITEEKTNYRDFSDVSEDKGKSVLLTQLDLKDFGLSYAIRLSDGRFILFDGGWAFEEDADNLFAKLSEEAEGDGIDIALWIMTHPHLDHYRIFFPFMEKYGDKVKVEKMLFNFFDADKSEEVCHPALANHDELLNLERFYSMIEERSIPVFRPHTGQVFEVGGVRIEMLFGPDNNFYLPLKGSNPISLAFKMLIEGQTILWTGDSQFQGNNFTDIYGDYLKCDIIQVPHHGFHGSTMALFNLAGAHTYFNPTFEDDCFGRICMKYGCIYKSWYLPTTRAYFTGSRTDEPIGINHVTLKLPFTPTDKDREALDELLVKYNVSEDNVELDF